MQSTEGHPPYLTLSAVRITSGHMNMRLLEGAGYPSLTYIELQSSSNPQDSEMLEASFHPASNPHFLLFMGGNANGTSLVLPTMNAAQKTSGCFDLESSFYVLIWFYSTSR